MDYKGIQNKHIKIKSQNYKQSSKINNYPAMTAKLRKELMEQKRGGQEPPADVQAVEQVDISQY